jgi:hypothetical protein
VLTLFDIIVTGNHYWIDGLGGLACLAAAFTIARAGTRWWEDRTVPRREGTVTA